MKDILIIIIKDILKRGLIMRGNFILLFVAMIWGAAFVAQKTGMDYVGAFTFNGVRFALGALSLIPLIYFFSKNILILLRQVSVSFVDLLRPFSCSLHYKTRHS